MAKDEFNPINDLEIHLIELYDNKLSWKQFYNYFLKSNVAVPSGTKVMADGSGMSPVFYNNSGINMMVIFTDLERVRIFNNEVPFCLLTNCFEFLSHLSVGCGIVVNPGYLKGFELPPAGLQKLMNDFKAGKLN